MRSGPRKVVLEVVLTPWRELKRQRRIAVFSETQADYLLRHDEETKYAMTGIRAAQPTNDTLYVKPEPMDIDLSGYTSVSVAHDQPRETVKKEEDIKPENENELVPYQVNVAQPCTDEEIKQAIQALSNPDAKIKRDLEFNYEFVWDRLKYVGTEWFPIDLDERTRYHTFSRYYISHLYGGGTVSTFPSVAPEKLAIHGINNFAFPSLEWNPHAPKHPGAPGLFFVQGAADWPIDDSRTFVRLNSGKWLYCGTYRYTPSESLTPLEFQGQADKVRRRWAKEMKSKKWGTDVVVRIHLRNTQGREPQEEEVQDICQDARNAQRIVDSVTEEQIINAFQVGEEELGVYCMKCIEYDAAWQQYLVDNYGEWEVGYIARRAQKQQRRRNGPTRKRHRVQDPEAERRRLEKLAGMGSDLSDLSDMDDDDSEEEIEEGYPPRTVQDIIVVDDEGMDEVQVLRSISRGTRSRPRHNHEPIVVD